MTSSKEHLQFGDKFLCCEVKRHDGQAQEDVRGGVFVVYLKLTLKGLGAGGVLRSSKHIAKDNDRRQVLSLGAMGTYMAPSDLWRKKKQGQQTLWISACLDFRHVWQKLRNAMCSHRQV